MTDSPTILFVLRAPIGGLFRHVVDLSAELEARGYKTGAVADSVTGAEAAETIARLDAALTHGVLLTPMPRLPGSKDMSALSAVAARARAIGAEVIHGHGAKGGLYARLAARRTGAKSVYTPHGGSLHYRWSRPSGMAFLGAERLLMGLTDAFIFESAYGKRAFEAKVGRPSCHTAVVPNGLMPGEFEPCTSVPEAEMADIGFVGELREIKGIDILLESLRELKSESGAPATLVIAGSGPDGDALKALTRSMGLEGRVRFLGRQPAREVFARSRVIAVPSRAESLPYIVLEAAAAGKPLVATNVGGIAEIAGPTADRLVPREDAPALARALQNLLTDPAAALEEAERRRAHVAATFSLDAMTKGVEAVYDKILQNGATPS